MYRVCRQNFSTKFLEWNGAFDLLCLLYRVFCRCPLKKQNFLVTLYMKIFQNFLKSFKTSFDIPISFKCSFFFAWQFCAIVEWLIQGRFLLRQKPAMNSFIFFISLSKKFLLALEKTFEETSPVFLRSFLHNNLLSQIFFECH